MADNNLSNLIPKGVIAESLINVSAIEFMKNMKMGSTSTPFKVGIDEFGIYRFLIDAKPTLNGFYFVKVKIDEDVSEFIITASARRSAYEGNDSFQNTAYILTATNPGVIYLERVELKAALSNDIGLIAILNSKNAVSPDIEVVVSSIGASELLSSPDTINYTVNIPVSYTGMKNAIEVFDDVDGKVDLNTYRRSGMVSCNPATESSRPPGSGTGMCLVAASSNGDKVHQLFLGEDSSFHFRSISMTMFEPWTTLISESTYPRITSSGRFFVSLTGSNAVRVPISNGEIGSDRHCVTITPESGRNEIVKDLEIYARGADFIDIGSSNKWDGNINWVVIEAYAPGMTPIYNLTIGRLDGNTLRPTTSVEVGQTIRVVLSTKNLVDGSVVPFTISGATSADIGIPLTGQFIVKNSSAYVDIKIVEDYIADGVKELQLSLDSSDETATMSIKNTSREQIFDIFFTSDPQGKNKITKLTSGFATYVVVKATGYQPGAEYQLDFTGSTLDLQTGTVDSIENILTFTLDDTGTFIKEILLNPLSITEKVINIVDTADVNLYELYKSKYGIPTKPVNVRFLNRSDNTIVASRASIASVTAGNFPANSTVSFDNYGLIYGRGGNGGFVEYAGMVNGLDGEMGGPAFDMPNSNFTFFVENYGSIYSGGGGGGATPTVRNYSETESWACVVGGCGGAPYGKTMGLSRVYNGNMVTINGGPEHSYWINKQVGDTVEIYTYRKNSVWVKRIGDTETSYTESPRLYNNDANSSNGVQGNTNLIYLGLETSRTVTPGTGGDPGVDGTDGITNQPSSTLAVRGGKGGKAGYVIAGNRKNAILRNHTGLIKGY